MRISDWSSDVCSSDLLEPIGGKAVHAHHRIGPLRAGANVVADAGLQVEPGIDRPAVKRLHFPPFQRAAEISLPPRLEGDAVEVAADPAFPFPMIAVGAPAHAIFHQRSEEPTYEPQSLMRIANAGFGCN